MKIGAINNFNLQYNQKSSKNSSFKAKVNVVEYTYDVISSRGIDLKFEPLKTITERVVPLLKKIGNDNLQITVSGAGKPLKFWDFFSKDHFGLKFDLSAFDIKRFYYDLMKDDVILKSFDKNLVTALKKKDKTLLNYCLFDSIGCGKLFYPEKGETIDQYVNTVVPMVKERARFLPKLLLDRPDVIYDAKELDYEIMGSFVQREQWQLYSGIETKYQPITNLE